MIYLVITAASAILGQASPPGPLDAFQANRAAVRVRTEFAYEWCIMDSPLHGARADAFSPGHVVCGTPRFRAEGRWEADGLTEHTKIEVAKAVAGSKAQIIQRGELLLDPELMVYRYMEIEQEPFYVRVNEPTPAPALAAVNPFYWFEIPLVNGIILAEFKGISPTRQSSVWGGFNTETEVYRKEFKDGWYQAEISYDPSVGYLPRFIRLISIGEQDVASVKEAYIRDARSCASGGFVPTEWCEASFSIRDFQKHYPRYSEQTKLTPSGRIAVGHLLVRRFDELVGSVALDPETRHRSIVSPSKILTTKQFSGPVTIKVIKEKLGNSPLAPRLRPVNIDSAELHEFTTPRSRSASRIIALSCVTAVLVVVVIVLRRRSGLGYLLVALITSYSFSGCGRVQDPPTRLTVAFDKPMFIYEPKGPTLDLHVRITNPMARPVKIFRIDGGCSCRKIDQTRLPLTLRGRESVSLSMTMDDRRRYGAQHITFQIATDGGPVEPRAILRGSNKVGSGVADSDR